MRFVKLITIAAAAGMMATTAQAADCVRKGAEATAGDEASAKWFALETMVQSVSWGLWPSFVANGSTPGYEITKQKYKCTKSGLSVTCRGAATFCKVKS